MEQERQPEPRYSTEQFAQLPHDEEKMAAFEPVVQDLVRAMALPWQRFHEIHGQYYEITVDDLAMNINSALWYLRGGPETRQQDDWHERFSRVLSPEVLALHTNDELAPLYFAVPRIAEAAFPPDFAQKLEERWQGTLRHWEYIDTEPSFTLDEIPPITEPVLTAADAKTQIIDDARAQLTKLDWDWATQRLDPQAAEKIGPAFDRYLPRILGRIQIAPLLAVVEHNAVPPDTDPAHQTALNEQQALLLTLGELSPEDATFMRDLLCTVGMEEIDSWLWSKDSDASGALLLKNPGILQAFTRSAQYLRLYEPPTPDNRDS